MPLRRGIREDESILDFPLPGACLELQGSCEWKSLHGIQQFLGRGAEGGVFGASEDSIWAAQLQPPPACYGFVGDGESTTQGLMPFPP